jgi:ketosteroid isomerase-like protein
MRIGGEEMKQFAIISLCGFIICIGCSLKKNLKDDLDSLVKAEQGFAQMSVDRGIQKAFLSHLSEESIIFRPGPVKGKPVYARPDTIIGFLNWKPMYADVSLDGKMGYTTGPWEFHRNGPDDESVLYGHYVSLWERQADGHWKVMLDAGINYQGPDTTIQNLEYAELYRNLSLSVNDHERKIQSLVASEKEYMDDIKEAGLVNAFSDFSTNAVRLYRNGLFPMTMKSEILNYLSSEERIIFSSPMDTRISDSGDLGYTYGVDSFKNHVSQIERYAYLRIWKRQVNDTWKIVLDLNTVIPEKVQQ